ncbi:MAG TPA: ParB/RepB/Spo0J family partition protein, partial [Mycobacteriales bacterium]
MSRRGGLGKGLGALIPTTAPAEAAPEVTVAPVEEPAAGAEPAADEPAQVPGASFREIPVQAIRPNAKQPRQVFDEDAQEELKTSIREFGLLQPVVVRETGPGAYELVMGERRWRASRDLGMAAIPAIVRETADDAMLRDALLENLHRAQLNPLEEAAAYRQLLDEFGTTHEEL